MNEKHYKENLSRFVNHELPGDERQRVAEHLLQCAGCRAAHDEIKFGAALAKQLSSADAPDRVWEKIEAALDGGGEKAKVSRFPHFSLFSLPGFAAAAAVLLLIGGLSAALYFGGLKNDSPETARREIPVQRSNDEPAQTFPPSNDISPNQNANSPAPATDPNFVNPILPNANVPPPSANTPTVPKEISPVKAPNQTAPPQNNPLPAWNIETLAGTPTAGDQTISKKGKLAVGDVLETDANSRARVEVANIGQVEVAPNSRVQLVNTSASEHRLALKKGILQAKIFAPPRLFIVDTPSAAAVDLGCEYTLEVDDEGNARLHVTSGFVALENGKFESIVPAGAIAVTKKGVGVGTPFAEDSSRRLQTALYKFDFEAGGAPALETIIEESNLYDSLTLWHLLARVAKEDRERVFDALASRVKPPRRVTREGILRLDRKMLDAWWTEIENVWFG